MRTTCHVLLDTKYNIVDHELFKMFGRGSLSPWVAYGPARSSAEMQGACSRFDRQPHFAQEGTFTIDRILLWPGNGCITLLLTRQNSTKLVKRQSFRASDLRTDRNEARVSQRSLEGCDQWLVLLQQLMWSDGCSCMS